MARSSSSSNINKPKTSPRSLKPPSPRKSEGKTKSSPPPRRAAAASSLRKSITSSSVMNPASSEPIPAQETEEQSSSSSSPHVKENQPTTNKPSSKNFCPSHPAESLESWLTAKTKGSQRRPTLTYFLAQSLCALAAIVIWCGSTLTPSLADAYMSPTAECPTTLLGITPGILLRIDVLPRIIPDVALCWPHKPNDMLQLVGVLVLGLCVGPGQSRLLAEVWQISRGKRNKGKDDDGDAYLPKIIDDDVKVPRKEFEFKLRFFIWNNYLDILRVGSRRNIISRLVQTLFWLSVALLALWILPSTNPYVFFWNLAGLIVGLMWNIWAGPASLVWVSTLHIATTVITFKINTLLDGTPTQKAMLRRLLDATTIKSAGETQDKWSHTRSNEWHREVARPLQRLLTDLDMLSKGWEKGIVLLIVNGCMASCGFLLIVLSPTLEPWIQSHLRTEPTLPLGLVISAHRTLFVALAMTNLAGPFHVIFEPASVSTAFAKLRGVLNDVRCRILKSEVDSRICILERAMAAANNGEGVGFCIYGFVVDTNDLLEPLVKATLALFTTAAGIALTYAWDLIVNESSVSSVITEHLGKGTVEEPKCNVLDVEQLDALNAVYSLMDSNCTYQLELSPNGARMLP